MNDDVNRVVLMGHLGRDPVMHETANGRFARFSLATHEAWRDKSSGELREHTEWHRVVAHEALADWAARYLRKGTHLFLTGYLESHKARDRHGVYQNYTCVVLDDTLVLSWPTAVIHSDAHPVHTETSSVEPFDPSD